jgi:alpha-1,3-rhamnosyl/mannosyltransferase
MKIAIETTALFTSRAGVARYVRGLLAGMKTVVTPADSMVELGWNVENFEYVQPGRALKTLAREWGWAKFISPRRARGMTVVHHTALPIMPFFRGPRHVVTLHDLALLRHPDRFRSWQRRAGVRRLRRVARADWVICASQFTADEAMALLGLSAARITVVHEGGWLPDAPAPAREIGGMEMPAEFFLFVGSLEPGKNLALLKQVYADAARTGSLLPPLLIAGARWAGVEHEGPPPLEWRFLGHVSDALLRRLYCNARALVFPSRYEGFGLPLVEAMALGCPVICAPVASLREIGGDAVCYAELTAPEFGAAMRRVISDAAFEAQLRAAGVARALNFSWEKCARETLDVYASATRG